MAVKHKAGSTGHTAGIFADMTLDGPEIGTLVAVIDRAKNLPNRKTMGKQDPYCAMRLGKEAKKTDTDRRGGQTPKWDQELRFTVHESPDYYKLKCSIFNDDKRTDLIGESWIDLSSIIKPGGGSNDLWHHLNYKGKYAGDIRIELTYYDLRPREEKATEKKKQREKAASIAHDDLSAGPAPRQLGPREVRRRPLPASPAATSPATASPVQTPPVSMPQQEAPTPPPKLPLDQHNNKYVQFVPQQHEDEQYVFNPYATDFPAVQPAVQHYRQPFCEEQSPTAEYEDEPSWSNTRHQQSEHNYPSSRSSMVPSPASLPRSSWPDEVEQWEDKNRRGSQQHTMASTERHSLSRALPSPPLHSTEPQYYSSRSNTSPIKPMPYRDSPLRSSMNQQDDFVQMVEEPDSYNPPPPPMHRETTPRRDQLDYPPSSFPQHEQTMVPFTPQPLNVSSRRTSVDERSPLQRIEQDYDAYSRHQAPLHDSFERQRSYDSHQEVQLRRHEDQIRQNPRAHPDNSDYHTPEIDGPYGMYHDQPVFAANSEHYRDESPHGGLPQEPAYRKPVYQDRSSSYDDRRLSRNPVSQGEYQNVVSHSNSQPNLPQTQYYKPQPIRSRPTSSNPSQTPQRKPISPGSYAQPDGRRLSAVPFGPDAYDVLNPASSPVTNDGTSYQTPEQAKETARMKEVDKLRDQGPIIGNDGRVIDPSDHLPSDTWAPEPERKTRRPEHVIHFRTKNDARSHSRPNSLPGSANSNPRPRGPSQDTPISSPASAPPSSGRNKLQKPRALPIQPYPRVQPEPRRESQVDLTPPTYPATQQAMQRYSHQDQPTAVHRPQLSEYQVPAHNNYVPRGTSFQNNHNPMPSKPQTLSGTDYNPRYSNTYDDPLAAELSMIDIGPARGGQIVLSGRRGY